MESLFRCLPVNVHGIDQRVCCKLVLYKNEFLLSELQNRFDHCRWVVISLETKHVLYSTFSSVAYGNTTTQRGKFVIIRSVYTNRQICFGKK